MMLLTWTTKKIEHFSEVLLINYDTINLHLIPYCRYEGGSAMDLTGLNLEGFV